MDVYSSAAPSTGRWYCVELHWKKGTTDGLAELGVDGVRVCSTTARNTAAYGDANQVRAGLPELYACASTTAYSDCIKLSNTYIGLEPVAPAINSFAVSPTAFSPNGDAQKDTASASAAFNVNIKWTLEAKGLSGVTLRRWSGTGNSLSVVWDGKDSSGLILNDGTYNLVLSGADLAGNQLAPKTIQVKVDKVRPAVSSVSMYPTSFSPRSGQTTKLSYTLSESCYVTVSVYSSSGSLARTLVNNVLQSSGLHSATWNGKSSSGTSVSAGTYTFRLYVTDGAGNTAATYPITRTVTVR